MPPLQLLRLLAGASFGALCAAPSFSRPVVCAPSSAPTGSGPKSDEIQMLSLMGDNTQPNLKTVMDPSKDVPPIKFVVVGGGSAGARIAYQLDCFGSLTLIDDKNYFEQAADIIPVIAREWTEATEETIKTILMVHRFYLKRANVLTGTAVEITPKKVKLQDGREVEYDILFVAQGEQKPFPFGSSQTTLAARIQELKHFNKYLATRRKVAIVGGGPMGVSLAGLLSEARPDMEVHLFHSGDHLVPAMPTLCQDYAEEQLAKRSNMRLHLRSRVTAIQEHFAGGSAKDKVPASDGFFTRLFARETSAATKVAPLPDTFSLSVDVLDRRPRKHRSLLHHLYFGPTYRFKASASVANREVHEGFDHVFSLIGDTPRPIPKGFLCKHASSDGHLRVSKLNQIFDHPNVFACGRCTNLPVLRSQAFSDAQARGVFRSLLAVIFTPKVERYLKESDGVRLQNYIVPRIVAKLGVLDGVGCNSWAGPMVGTPAVMEHMLDKQHQQQDFFAPVFYKPQNPTKVRQKLVKWMENEITDVCDFSF
jgi:NADH dehydrogenase FAD-containing subunit